MTNEVDAATLDAIEGVKKNFLKMGLSETGEVVDKKNASFKKLQSTFEENADKVEAEWKGEEPEVVDKEVLATAELDEEDTASVDHDGINQELLKTQAELKARDDAIAKMQQMIDDLSEKTTKQQKADQERILESIEQQRKQAIKNGDYDSVIKLDQQKTQVTDQSSGLDPLYSEFLKRNPWWNGTSSQEIKMRIAANQYDNILTQRKLAPAQAISLLEDYIKADFPEYFDKSTNKTKAVAAVEGNVKAGIVNKSKRSYTVDNLSNEAQFIAKEFKRLKVMDTDKYIEELANTGLIK